jgi:hypothetical protein
VKHVQVMLRAGTTVRTCWLPARVRAGSRVTLKGDGEDSRTWWDVTWRGTQERELTEINRGWHNNI